MKQRLLFLLVVAVSFTMHTFAQYEADFQMRKAGLINYITTSKPAGVNLPFNNPCGGTGDYPKHFGPDAVAFYEKYGLKHKAVSTRDSMRADSIVLLFRDCPTFHFNLLGMIRPLMLYPTDDTVSKYTKNYVQKVFDRTDNFNVWTSEGTENHIAMARCCGYLYVQIAKEKFPADFPTATTKLAELKNWILSYSKAIYSNGTAEYNSTQYNAYNISPWICLYDFATDEDVRKAALAVIDYYATEIAIHYSWGTLGGVEQRSASGAVDNRQESGEMLGWLWYGGNTSAPPQGFGKEAGQSMHAATSSYRPNANIVALGQKTMSSPIWYTMSRSSYLFERKGHVKSFFYATQNYSIGSAVTGYGGFSGGSYAQVDFKVIMKKASGYPVYISGNGRVINNDKGRGTTPFTQYVQHKNVVIMLTYTPSDWKAIFDTARAIGGTIANNGTANPNTLVPGTWQKLWYDDFYTRFPTGAYEGNTWKYPVTMMSYNTTNPQYSYLSFTGGAADYAYNGRYMVVKYNTSYIAVQFFNSNAPTTEPSARGAIYDQNASLGQLTGFIIEMADAGEYADANAYLTNFMTRTTSIDKSGGSVSYTMKDGTVLYAKYDANGTFYEALYDWGYGPTTQQTKLHTDHVTPTAFMQPDWTLHANLNNKTGRFPIFKINSDTLKLKATNWPVINDNLLGKISLSGEVLTINDDVGAKAYEIDYTGTIPVFWPTWVSDPKKQELHLAADYLVYPNPSDGTVYISGVDNYNCPATVYNSAGILAWKGIIQQGKINLGYCKPGIYILVIQRDGELITKKIQIY